MILSTNVNQTIWGAQVKRPKVGTAQRFSSAARESLIADLAPQHVTRAREVATG